MKSFPFSVFISVHLWFVCLAPHGSYAAELLIRNACLIDGTGAAAKSSTAILVRAGRVAEIGPAIVAAGVVTIDAAGATVLPGLIDAHIHNDVVPG
jgi:imidazolonepropionase-like amidohydrolase